MELKQKSKEKERDTDGLVISRIGPSVRAVGFQVPNTSI